MHHKYMKKNQSPYYLNTICSQEIRENKQVIQENKILKFLYIFELSHNGNLHLSLVSDVHCAAHFSILFHSNQLQAGTNRFLA